MLQDFFKKFEPTTEVGRKVTRYTGIAAAIAVALLIPAIAQTSKGGWLPLGTVVLCAVYALFSLGLNIVVGFAGLLDFQTVVRDRLDFGSLHMLVRSHYFALPRGHHCNRAGCRALPHPSLPVCRAQFHLRQLILLRCKLRQ